MATTVQKFSFECMQPVCFRQSKARQSRNGFGDVSVAADLNSAGRQYRVTAHSRAAYVGAATREIISSSDLRELHPGSSCADNLSVVPPVTYDIFGIGEAIVDYSGMVSYNYLKGRNVESGGRRVIDIEERGQIIEELQAQSFVLNAGGSLSNTLRGVSVLGHAAREKHPHAGLPPRIGMTGCIGSDGLGEFFRKQLQISGVEWIGTPTENTSTGTVFVLTTPDAQRSFLSHPSSSSLGMCPATATSVASARMTVIEGYMWETPNATENITRIIDLARAAGSIIVMTAADVSVVRRHRTAMLSAISACDVVFANQEEASELLHGSTVSTDSDTGVIYAAEQHCSRLGQMCPMAVVTSGSKGSCIAALGQMHCIPPKWSATAPVDTCGAGDAYAAGFLHAYLKGSTVHGMGQFAAACASSVISRQGPHLTLEDAAALFC